MYNAPPCREANSSRSSYRRRKSPCRLSASLKLQLIEAIEELRATGRRRTHAVEAVARAFGVSKSSVYLILRQRDNINGGDNVKTAKPRVYVLRKNERRRKLTRDEVLKLVQLATTRDQSRRRMSWGEIGKQFGISMTHAYEIYLMRDQLFHDESDVHVGQGNAENASSSPSRPLHVDTTMDTVPNSIDTPSPSPAPPASLASPLAGISPTVSWRDIAAQIQLMAASSGLESFAQCASLSTEMSDECVEVIDEALPEPEYRESLPQD